MASTWASHWLEQELEADFERHFNKEQDKDSSLTLYFKAMVNNLRVGSSFLDSLQVVLAAWEHVARYEANTPSGPQLSLMVESLGRASRHLALAGDWAALEAPARARLEALLRQCLHRAVGRPETIESLLKLAATPWDTPRVRALLLGRAGQQKEVLELVSGEGVACLLLRVELLVESGMDKPAYKFVSTVTSSLLADHVVFYPYVTASPLGCLERLIDLALGLAIATRHEARLYKLLRLVGIEDVNTVYLPRFTAYTQPQPETPDPRLAPPAGRCARLFTAPVCSKLLRVFCQWSIAGAAVTECPDELQTGIIRRWLEGQLKEGRTLPALLPDIQTLVRSATQTSFLYSMAWHLWQKMGAEVEEMCLKMFIKGLNWDINACEAHKRHRTKRMEIEKRLARGFWLLSQMVKDRVSLARECVLTGFSISPSQEMFERIVEFAIHSGLDKIGGDVIPEEVGVKEETDKKASACRVTIFKKNYNIEKAPGTGCSTSAFSLLDDGKFESSCSSLLDNISSAKYGKAEAKLGKTTQKKKKFRNLEGLLSIQGELITEAENYDPTAQPCQSLSPEALGLSAELTADLMILIMAPRWHLLSWVLEWPELQRTCAKLLANPSMRIPSEELKFLNIDYTQFDEWSSDEELTIYTGIEKGYEMWLDADEEKEEAVSEHGISEDEEVVFHTKHTFDKNEYDDNNFIESLDYMDKEGDIMEIKDEFTDEAIKSDAKAPFVNETLEPEPEKPEKATRSSKRKGGAGEESMEVNFALVPSRDCSRLRQRLLLARLVPGLENSAVPPQDAKVLQVWMVQIGGVGVGSAPSSPTPGAPAAPSSPGLLLRPGPSGVTRAGGLARTTMALTASTGPRPTVRLSPASPASPRVVATASPSPSSPAKKIQYICKQGGQTFIIESAQVLEKLRGAGLAGGTGSVQLRLPISAVRPTITVNNENKVDSVSLSEGLAGRLGTLLNSSPKLTPSPQKPPASPVSVTIATGGKAVLGSQAVLVSAGLTGVKAATPAAGQPAATETGKPAEAGGPADLIRQLNLARAQGLVVLQQWGDKQVLVHKATGRWIMRQGSRLVTVPPQALGIGTDGTNSSGSSPGPAISSRTMEQLAEFDSILESKFKTEIGEPVPNGGVVVVSGAGNTRQVIQLPTTPLKKELVLSKDGQGLGLKAGSPVKSPLLPPAAAFPKPQEDPETMKRIQAILDDYNDQIRNSPDLHNRPAPRRRTNGSGSPESPKAGDSPPSSSPTSGASSPSTVTMQCDGSPSPSLSPSKDPLTVAMAEIKESGALTLATQPTPSPAPQVTSVRLVPKTGGTVGGLARGLVVQAGQAGGLQRLMVVQTSGDGRRMVAVRPVIVSTNSLVTSSSSWTPTYITVNTSSSATSLPITVSLPTRPVSPTTLAASSPPRPSTPGLGIPMEMTPGQIMEAEISATLLDDPSSPYACPSMPDNVFSVSSPGPAVSSCPGLDSDFDQVVSTSSGQQAVSSVAEPAALVIHDLPQPPATTTPSSPAPALPHTPAQPPAPSLATAPAPPAANPPPTTAKRRRSARGLETPGTQAKRPRLGGEVARVEEAAAGRSSNLPEAGTA